MATFGWVTDVEADAYMATRIGASTYWCSGAEKNAALQTAYNDLLYCKRYEFPSPATAEMKVAQFEQALFRIQNGDGIDQRMGLRSQGVVVAGVVKETYIGNVAGKGNELVGTPICTYAKSILDQYLKSASIFLVDLERTEGE